MQHSFSGPVFPDVSKDRVVFLFTVNQCSRLLDPECLNPQQRRYVNPQICY
jgi:hypothetical protein